MDFYYGDHWRMDWGFGNPNKTAALIATLMIASWLPAWRDARRSSRRPWFWMSLVAFLILGVCLVHTYSRGGLVAAAVGSGVVLCFLPRPWSRSIAFPVGAGISILVGYAFLGPSEAGQRYVQGLGAEAEDRSITNRLEIWRRAPAMIADAPDGWGIGQSGFAYTQYYQPLETRFTYRTLVNSHLTWLVEFGRAGRFAYLAGWLLLLALTWPPGLSSPLPFAAWLALGVAGFFSSVLEAGLLFAVPALLLIPAVQSIRQTDTRRTRYRIAIIFAGAGALLAGTGLWLGGKLSDRGALTLHHADGITSLTQGESHPTSFLLYRPDLRVVGNHFGVAVRRHLLADPKTTERWMVTMEPQEVLPESEIVILSGPLDPAELPSPPSAATSQIVYLNPTVPDFRDLEKMFGHPEAQSFIMGDRLRDRSTVQLKQAIRASGRPLVEIGGARTYLPSWIEAVARSAPTSQKNTP